MALVKNTLAKGGDLSTRENTNTRAVQLIAENRSCAAAFFAFLIIFGKVKNVLIEKWSKDCSTNKFDEINCMVNPRI